MAIYQVIKTITYDLVAEVNDDEFSSSEELREFLLSQGDNWVEYEQPDGEDFTLTVEKVNA